MLRIVLARVRKIVNASNYDSRKELDPTIFSWFRG